MADSGTMTTETRAGRAGFRVGAGAAAVALSMWAILTSLSGIFTLMPAPDDPLALVLLALLTAGVLALPAGIIVIAAAGWQPGLTMLVTHGVFSLVVTAVFFVMVIAGPWGAAGMALAAAVIALGQLARERGRAAAAG